MRFKLDRPHWQGDKRWDGVVVSLDEVEALEGRLKAARDALEQIANDPHTRYERFVGRDIEYSTGVADGHRCAANRATKALAQLDAEQEVLAV